MKTIKDILPPCKIANIKSYRSEVRGYFENGLPQGISTGWSGFDEYFRLLKGQLNILSGVPGTGKSEWLDSMAVNLALNKKWNIFTYSPENYPLSLYTIKLSEKIIGKPFRPRGAYEPMSVQDVMESEEFLDQKFTIIDSGTKPYSLQELMETIEYVIKYENKRIDMAIVDPWNELDGFRPTGMTETDYIGECLMKTRRFARQHDISFWIVVHPAKMKRKADGTYPEMTLYDLSGSQHWYNKSDNGIIMHRTHEQKMNSLILQARVLKVKNRLYGRVGEHHFEFQPWCGRYVDHKIQEESTL